MLQPDALAFIRRLSARNKELHRANIQLEAQVPKWISVDERLPETDENVLCWYEYFRFGDYNCMFQTYGIGCYFHGSWFGEVSNGQKTKVLYWMPLPKPPKEG